MCRLYKSRTGKRLYIREKAASMFLDVLVLFLDKQKKAPGGGEGGGCAGSGLLACFACFMMICNDRWVDILGWMHSLQEGSLFGLI